jgi:predicted nucleotidyltransferase
MLNEDYREMLQGLSDSEVRFLVVGAYAMGAYGYPRATGDIDIWVDSTIENSKRVYTALARFGAPLGSISESTFTEPGIVFQIGIAPRRIDILTHIDGVRFWDVYESKEIIEVDGLKIPFLSQDDLIKNKRATGREKDKLDADCLLEFKTAK